MDPYEITHDNPLIYKIANAIADEIQTKYPTITPELRHRAQPHYRLYLGPPPPYNQITNLHDAVEIYYHRTRIELAELIYGEADLTFRANFYAITATPQLDDRYCYIKQIDRQTVPLEFESVIEYCDPDLMEKLYELVEVAMAANVRDHEHPVVDCARLQQLGTIRAIESR